MKIETKAIAVLVIVISVLVAPVTSVTGAHASTSTDLGQIAAERQGGNIEVTWAASSKTLDTRVYVDGRLVSVGASDGSALIEDIDTTPDAIVLVQTSPINDDVSKIALPDYILKNAPSNQGPTEAVSLLGVTLGNADSGQSLQSANASVSAASTLLRYQTFIPEEYVKAPSIGCAYSGDYDYYFGGDNRSFTPGSSKVRTRLDANIDWINRVVSATPLVGMTHVWLLFNGTYSLKARDTASSSSMKILSPAVSSTKATFEMKQDVVNPFCTSNGIYFDMNVAVYRSGAYSMTGARLIIPNHEVYIIDSDASTWTPILQAGHYPFELCLSPVISVFCTDNGVSLSGTR